MASWSFKPASYLATATAQQSQKSGGVRPTFNRTYSSSSSKSDDSGLENPFEDISTREVDQPNMGQRNRKRKLEEKDTWKENRVDGAGGSAGFYSPTGSTGVHRNSSPSSPTSSHSRSFFDEVTTPRRKGSQPIAIELPPRDRSAVYTPLSARGDLPGGYFPNHEDITRSYITHPFSSHNNKEDSTDPDTPFEMSMSALGSPVSAETTPGVPQSLLSPTFGPESLAMPLGKYHPSNYKSSVSRPRSPAVIPSFPSTNLAIPSSTGKRSTSGRPGHERKTSDVKRKLQQYQRDMIAQAHLAGVAAAPCGSILKTGLKEPTSPRLEPAGSPGPITPFELEESAGYLAAGSRARTSLVGSEVEVERQRELQIVEGIISREEKRRDGFAPSLRV